MERCIDTSGQHKAFEEDFCSHRLRPTLGIVNLMQKTARLYSKERTIEGFVLPRTPVFSLLIHPQISSREKRLGAIFNKLTMP